MKLLQYSEAVAALMGGNVVAVPTDTVYGVAARLSDPQAVARLFAVKRRPGHVALPVLVSSLHDVAELEVQWPAGADILAASNWPGALTIVVGAHPATAARVGATNSLGLRWPHHDMLEGLIDECGPLAVTSANEHAHAPCISVTDVLAASWGAPLAGVLDGGRCAATVSSVVEFDEGGWHLRRQGAVDRAEIEALLGPESAPGDD